MEADRKAVRERVSSFAGAGCALQALGLVAPWILWELFGVPGAIVGAILLVWLFFVGSAKAMSWRCGGCKNPIASKNVRVCPVCRADLS